MQLPHIVTLLGGLCVVTFAQRLDSELQYTENLVPDVLGLSSRTAEAVEGFDYSNPDVVDAALAEWAEKAKTGNKALPDCPAACSKLGKDPAAWAVFPDAEALTSCNKTQLLSLAIHTIADGQEQANAIRACSADFSTTSSKTSKRSNATSCIPASGVETSIAAQLETSGSAILASSFSEALLAAGRQISSYLGQLEPDCDTSAVTSFATAGKNGVLGVYGGAEAHRQGVTTQLLDKFLSRIAANGISEGLVAELCVPDADRGADYVVGVAASTKKNGLEVVQNAMRLWSNNTCITSGRSAASGDSTNGWARFSLRVPATVDKNNTATISNTTASTSQVLTKRADCRVIRVVTGDGCPSLASKCGISPADFTTYNSKTDCSKLVEGQPVCCSSGSLPPKPTQGSDGACAAYTVIDQDFCAKIAATNQITIAELEEFNKNTWGWNGCETVMWSGINICLSKGDPPMPASVANADCGPTVPGTKRPTDGTQLKDLNPCPLNVCCNVWGHCGLSEDFCIEKKSATGAPGTSALKNGCVASCGMDVRKDPIVDSPIRIGYFEGWNGNRPCLRSHATQYKDAGYTHIHWGFANLTEDFVPDVSGLQEEFDMFKGMTGVKRIISFGGWAFSTEAGTWPIFKNAVKPVNRATFTKNVLKFVNDNGLDGADFDWEYPAAPDIDGVPAGDLSEGTDYAKFLASMKSAMPSGKTVSFAAPASYWYLKQFPIKTIASVVDYIVYMSYDLHGQWDAGNAWATPGCPTGNCLRSHVNATETLLALAMIQKAGVPSKKVIVGVSSYGRSFHMAQAGCTGPDCQFTGDRLHSEAAKGECTDTAGYISNAEIEDIIAKGGNIKTWSENSTDYLVYNDVEWVSYMSPITKSAREVLYSIYGFGGTTDWAIDLQSYLGDSTYDNPGDIDDMEPRKDCDKTYGSLDDIDKDADSIPDYCMGAYILDALAGELDKGISDYDGILKTDYDEKFGYYAKAVKQKWSQDLDDFYHAGKNDEFFTCMQAEPTDTAHVYNNVTIDCPPDHIDGHAYNLYMIPKDEKKLSDYLNDQYSIDYTWTHGKKIEIAPCIDNFCDEWHWFYGSLELRPDFDVPNPKEDIGKSIGNIRDLPAFFRSEADTIKINWFGDQDPADAVDGAAVPVFMIQQAVKSMHDIYEAGAKIEKEEMKNLIITCLTAFLFILPGLGEAMAAITGIAMIARIATMVAEVGGLASGAYDIATNKDNLAVGIFSLLLGFVGLKGALKGTWKDAASLRRKLSSTEIDGMGDIFKNGLSKVSGLSSKMCKL